MVFLAKTLKSSSLKVCGVFPILNLNIANLAVSSGKGMYILFSNLYIKYIYIFIHISNKLNFTFDKIHNYASLLSDQKVKLFTN